MAEEKKMQALDDEELDNVSGGVGITNGRFFTGVNAYIYERPDLSSKCRQVSADLMIYAQPDPVRGRDGTMFYKITGGRIQRAKDWYIPKNSVTMRHV